MEGIELTINLVTMTRFIKQQMTSLTNQFSEQFISVFQI